MIKIKKIIGTEYKKIKSSFKIDPARKMFGYGMELTLNLYACSLEKISTRKHLQEFVIILCRDIIHMKRYGKTLIPNFGHDSPTTSGYSLVQLIETSSVTGHFSDSQRSCYLNIFSCSYYDAQKTAQFCKDFFEAKKMDVFLTIRP